MPITPLAVGVLVAGWLACGLVGWLIVTVADRLHPRRSGLLAAAAGGPLAGLVAAAVPPRNATNFALSWPLALGAAIALAWLVPLVVDRLRSRSAA